MGEGGVVFEGGGFSVMCGPKTIPEMMRMVQRGYSIIKHIQSKVEALEVVGESGAGMVKVTLRGNGRIKNVAIASTVMKEHPETVEDLVATAVNKAQEKLDEEAKKAYVDLVPPDIDPNIFFRTTR